MVAHYIRRFRLEGLEHHLPRQLSGGQKQRVALARMMASQPEILLLDEPLSALDSFLKWQVEEELQDLLSEIGKTVLFVSHSRDEVYHLCDRICVLDKGHIETVQEKKEFFANPVTRAAARISGCRNIVPAKRLSEHQLDVPDWGICFELEKEIPDGIVLHQIDNEANTRIHSQTTAKEILRDTEGKIDAVVAGVGTGGTITGIGKVLKEENSDVQIIAVEPESSQNPGYWCRFCSVYL